MRKLLLGAALLLGLWGLIVAITGGVDARLAGVAIRSRDPFRAAAVGVALVVFVAIRYRLELTPALDRAGARLGRYTGPLAVAGAAALAAHGIVFGAFSVGGSDSYCYVNQAYDWAAGHVRPLPLPLSLPPETSDFIQVPLGYTLGDQPHTMAPVCAPGLSLLMAAALVAGACGPFFVVPIMAALFAWFTYKLGRLAGGPIVGLIAVLVLMASPVVLFQAIAPMSDIPAGALWTGAVACALGSSRRSAAAAGLCAGLALLVRPNLVPLCAAPLLAIVLNARGRARVVQAALFCAPIVPVAVFIATVNTLWFGAATRSGYGPASGLYSVSNIWPNLKLNASWLWTSQSPWVLFALVPLLPPFARRLGRGPIAVCVLLCAVTLGSYLSYMQFGAWWYLRFLIPAFGALAVLVAAGVVSIARAIRQPFGPVAAGIGLYAMLIASLTFAGRQAIFGGMRTGERRYIVLGEFVADHLPANAALLAGQHSGSLRFYSARMTLRYEWVDPAWASGLPSVIERAGYHPYLVVDDREIPQVREQFGIPPDGTLPWPVFAHTSELAGMTIFDLATTPGPSAPRALPTVARHWCSPRRGPI